jgi:DNA replication protein
VKPSDREIGNIDFLSGSFFTIPHMVLARYRELGIGPAEFLVLLQIFAAQQVEKREFPTPQELAELCNMTSSDVAQHIETLVNRGLLSIGERLDDQGTHSNYFDLKPLWTRLRGRDPMHNPTREWRKDPITLFEEEFGRPLSGLECEQIRQWIERDGHPEWMIVEALREAVLANKYSFRYIDRILYDWYRNRIRTKAELEEYRASYRERIKAREEAASARSDKPSRSKAAKRNESPRDERYAAFYELFPDS